MNARSAPYRHVTKKAEGIMAVLSKMEAYPDFSRPRTSVRHQVTIVKK